MDEQREELQYRIAQLAEEANDIDPGAACVLFALAGAMCAGEMPVLMQELVVRVGGFSKWAIEKIEEATQDDV